MKRTITVLQAGRAVAAIAVLLHHCAVATQDFVGAVPRWLAVVLENGFRGVDLFCVLSGFIMHAHGGDTHVRFGLSLALVLPGLVRMEARGRLTVPEWLMLLGKTAPAPSISSPRASLGARSASRIEGLNAWPVILARCAALGIGVGVLDRPAFEKTVLRWFGRRDVGASPAHA